MTEALMNRIKAQLVRHEDLKLMPFRCTAGKLTIMMYGFQIKFGMTDDRGISQKEAYAMLAIHFVGWDAVPTKTYIY